MQELLQSLGIRSDNPGASTGEWIATSGKELTSTNPTTGEPIATVRQAILTPSLSVSGSCRSSEVPRGSGFETSRRKLSTNSAGPEGERALR